MCKWKKVRALTQVRTEAGNQAGPMVGLGCGTKRQTAAKFKAQPCVLTLLAGDGRTAFVGPVVRGRFLCLFISIFIPPSPEPKPPRSRQLTQQYNVIYSTKNAVSHPFKTLNAILFIFKRML